ncbi:MAG: hypothetical protein NT117_01490, partial [Gammaproteobacteria bacterium]|nr:hypothetical protein [Gammaproteobacteria bacterium]
WINERVSGEQEVVDSEAGAGEQVAPTAVAPLPAVKAQVSTGDEATPDQSPLYVSACIDSGDRCRCLDKQGRDLKLETQDCRAMLKLVNGE